MSAAKRIFAGELNRSTTGNRGNAITPSGAVCSRIFIVGALTEVTGSPETAVRARISDPTGTFILSTGRGEHAVAGALSAIKPPAFAAVTGTVKVYGNGSSARIRVHPEAVSVTTREIRDLWLLRTADLTINRLKNIQNTMDEDEIRELLSLVSSALASVKSDEPVSAAVNLDPCPAILEIIVGHSGPRGVTVDELKTHALGAGIPESTVERCIANLLEDGDCYTPCSGYIKLL